MVSLSASIFSKKGDLGACYIYIGTLILISGHFFVIKIVGTPCNCIISDADLLV